MNKLMTFLLTGLLAAALFLSSGCQRKDLLDPHPGAHHNLIIKAGFDSLALSQLLSIKSEGYSNPGEPKTTKCIIFEKTTQNIAYKGTFKGLEGGTYLQEGIYDLLLYTSDFHEYDANFYRGLDKFGTAETYTRQKQFDEASARNNITEMYMVEPDPTFSIYKPDIIVLGADDKNVLELELVQKSFKYYLTIHCKGLQNIHTAKMNISGMYTSAFLASDDHRMDEAGIQSVDMDITRYDPADKFGEGEIYGEFWSFGPNQNEIIQNSITLYFINGDVITMKLKDLTSQIKTLTRGGEIIVEEYLEIKGPAGGFNPGVGDWKDPTDVEFEI